uniref:Uncharacterized protein n=1 Tax=Arundo donax TaxID=35708 RepID=A0A0A9BDK9_ARUDO
MVDLLDGGFCDLPDHAAAASSESATSREVQDGQEEKPAEQQGSEGSQVKTNRTTMSIQVPASICGYLLN